VTLTLDKEQPPPAADKDTTNDKPKDDWKWSAKAEGKKGAGNGSGKVTGSASASASGTWPSSDGTASPAGANESPRVIDQWSVQGGAEAGKFEATAQRTSATGTAPETKAEIGHHELLNADGASAPVSPATNAAPPVDYTHGSSLVP
jgi:hypothetical protein